jgi:PAS domain S-box-containing protein
MMNPQTGRLEHVKEGAMLRMLDGTINDWNRRAEELYGWSREDAVGRVSHELLRTRFPQPLEEIESELVKKGRWQGELVHVARDGGQVVVESRWILDLTRDHEAVVEINAPSSNDQSIRGKSSHASHLKSSGIINRSLETIFFLTLSCLAGVWVLHALFGRLLIRSLYASDWVLSATSLMAGRAFTPVENYYWQADRLLWSGTLTILALLLICWLIVYDVRGTLLAVFSALISSFLFFCGLEMAPSLIKTLHLDNVSPYFAAKANYDFDEHLIFKEKPFNHSITANFKGSDYSPIYGIDVPSAPVEWRTDGNGFRNSRQTNSADIVVLGDSYMDYGYKVSDTMPSRLEEKLSGLTVMNLGKSGYGPFQYLEVLKRFGLNYHPRYAIFAFYEGNDILDIQHYRYWKAGELTGGDPTFLMTEKSLLRRYGLALRTTARQLNKAALLRVQAAFDKNPLLGEERSRIHPDLALLDLGAGKLDKMLIDDGFTRWREAMFERENWLALENILREFREVCAAHHITPIVLYIPSSSHIYAQFSTSASGGNWLALRETEIASKENTENAIRSLVQAVGLDFLSSSAILERGAKEGKLLYFPLDPHWTPEGTELVANYVADYLKTRYLSSAN